jgi:condensin complex subunit 1
MPLRTGLIDSGRFGVAEQAIGAIYALSKHPDILCSDILRRKTKSVFSKRPLNSHGEPTEAEEDPTITHERQHVASDNKNKGALALSQLLFIVGHIASTVSPTDPHSGKR